MRVYVSTVKCLSIAHQLYCGIVHAVVQFARILSSVILKMQVPVGTWCPSLLTIGWVAITAPTCLLYMLRSLLDAQPTDL